MRLVRDFIITIVFMIGVFSIWSFAYNIGSTLTLSWGQVGMIIAIGVLWVGYVMWEDYHQDKDNDGYIDEN